MSDTSKPAFPRSGPGGDEGMSLRDFFAAAALQGICAHRAITDEWAEENLARAAYHWADAMLAQREKP